MNKKNLADDFYFDLDNEVSYDEPIIYEMDGPHEPFAQAIIGTEEGYCVEIAGPRFLKLPLTGYQTAQLQAMRWNMPINENMPNFWRDYPKGTRKRLITSDVADALTKAFNCKNKLCEMVDPYGPDSDELDTMVDALKAADGKKFFSPYLKTANASKFNSVWQDYESQNFECSSCKMFTAGKDAILGEYSTSKMLELDCPECGLRLANVQLEASAEEIKSFAKAGLTTAE